jgi:hypothetical protein
MLQRAALLGGRDFHFSLALFGSNHRDRSENLRQDSVRMERDLARLC